MLLSRVAESLYWAGRYLERAEATARLRQGAHRAATSTCPCRPASAGRRCSPSPAAPRRSTPATTGVAEDDVVRVPHRRRRATRARCCRRSCAGPREPPRSRARSSPAPPGRSSTELFLCVHRTARGRRRPPHPPGLDRAQVIEQLPDRSRVRSSSTMSHDEAYSFLEIGRARRAGRHDDPRARRAGRASSWARSAERRPPVRRRHVDERAAARCRREQMFRRSGHGGASGPDGDPLPAHATRSSPARSSTA